MKNVKIAFTEKNLTRNAGLVHFGKFIEKLKIREILMSQISISRASNALYQVADAVIMLMLGVIAGAKHMSHMAILRTDDVIRSIFDWKDFPDDSTMGRIFRLFSHASCQELSDAEEIVRRKVWKKKWFSRVTLDFDSEVDGVYGAQEGAETGYNPKKRGQKSYHPLLCFLAETRECLHSWFRCGSAYSANGIVDFAMECFARLPKKIFKVFVRADSAFFNGAFLDMLEGRGAQYLIKVKMRNLETILSRPLQKWTIVKQMPGYEFTEFMYQCSSWAKLRRFVAVRKLVKVETEGVLFPENVYKYFCYVTNENLTPWQAHKLYGQRADSENWIEWCKNQMAAGSILTRDFWANSAIFQTCILGYNLMAWLMWLKQDSKISEEPNTIRFRLIHVPGRLLASGRQLILKLSKNWFSKDYWIETEETISSLQFQ